MPRTSTSDLTDAQWETMDKLIPEPSRRKDPAVELRLWRSSILATRTALILCILILQWRHVAASNWSSAMLLLAIPGMIGEAVVLLNLSTFMPKIHQSSGGKYGAFLFATYALVLGMAEIVTLRGTR